MPNSEPRRVSPKSGIRGARRNMPTAKLPTTVTMGGVMGGREKIRNSKIEIRKEKDGMF
jgi:hypothetical protein